MFQQGFTGKRCLPTILNQHLFRTVSPMAILQSGARTNSFPEEPQVLQYFAMCLAICDVADVSYHDIQPWIV